MEYLPTPSDYEVRAITEIHQWKNPEMGWFDKAMEIVNKPIEKAGDLVTSVPGVDWVIEKAIGGLVGLLNDFAHCTVRTGAIYEEYRKMGFSDIEEPKDILKLDLEHVDRVIGIWVQNTNLLQLLREQQLVIAVCLEFPRIL